MKVHQVVMTWKYDIFMTWKYDIFRSEWLFGYLVDSGLFVPKHLQQGYMLLLSALVVTVDKLLPNKPCHL